MRGNASANAYRSSRDAARRDAVHVGGHAVDRRAVGAHDADQHDRRAAVRRVHLAGDRERRSPCATRVARLELERLDRIDARRRGDGRGDRLLRPALFSSWNARYACVTSAAGP